MKTVLVSGANGYIASRLIAELIGKYTVFAIVRDLDSSLPQAVSRVYADLSQRGCTKFLPADVDYLFHFAHSNEYRNFPVGAEDMFDVNVGATFELLEWGRKTGLEKFIYASTGTIYGSGGAPFREDSTPTIRSLYSATKYLSEVLLSQYNSFFSPLILRFFGVYGPQQKDKMISDMIDRVRQGKEITLAAGRGLTINPIYIDDAVNAVLELVNKGATGTFNVAGNETLTYRDMSLKIAENLRTKPRYKHSAEEPISLVADIEALKSYYRPQYSFEKTIPELVI